MSIENESITSFEAKYKEFKQKWNSNKDIDFDKGFSVWHPLKQHIELSNAQKKDRLHTGSSFVYDIYLTFQKQGKYWNDFEKEFIRSDKLFIFVNHVGCKQGVQYLLVESKELRDFITDLKELHKGESINWETIDKPLNEWSIEAAFDFVCWNYIETRDISDLY